MAEPDEEATPKRSGGVVARRLSLLALVPAVLFGSLAHVFGGLPVGLGTAGAVAAGGTGYAAWHGRKVRKTAKSAGWIRRRERRTVTRTRPQRSGQGRPKMPSLGRRRSGAGKSGTPSAFRRKSPASRGGAGSGGVFKRGGARKGGPGLGRRSSSSPAKAGGRGAKKSGPASRSRLGLRSGGAKSSRGSKSPASKGSSRRSALGKRGGAGGSLLRRHRPNGSTGRRQRAQSPIRRRLGSKGPGSRRNGSRGPGSTATQTRRRGLARLVPAPLRRRSAAKSGAKPTARTGARPGARTGSKPASRPGTRAAVTPVRKRRTAAQRAALRKANRRPPLTRRQKLAQRLRRTRPAGRGMFARSWRHPVRPQRLTPQQRRARQARIRNRRALLRRGWHPRQWRLPRRHRPPMSLARRIPDRFKRTQRAVARFDQWRLGRWLASRRFRARRPALPVTMPLAPRPVRTGTSKPGPVPRPGGPVRRTQPDSQPAAAGTSSSGGPMTFSSRVQAVAETAHEQIGSWEPSGGKDLEQAIGALPELCEELAQAIGSIGAKMGDGPFEQAAAEAFMEAASRFSGLGDEFSHAHQVFRSEHADELRRLEEPRQREEMWDTDKQEETV